MLALLACASTPEVADDARTGFKFRQIPEGLVVTEVESGSMADSAGLVPGTLISSVWQLPIAQMQSAEVRAATANLLRESLLQTLNNGMEPTMPVPHGGWPAHVRRAEEYIDANLGQAISIADLAVVAGVWDYEDGPAAAVRAFNELMSGGK